jgi:outer membrane protein TolC
MIEMIHNITNFLRPTGLKVLFIYLGLLIAYGSFGQSPDVQRTTRPGRSAVAPNDTFFLQDIATQLLPFDELYAQAVTHSPLVKVGDEQMYAMHQVYRLSKMKILDQATGFVNYSVGNQSIVSSNTYTTDQIGQIANGYRVGVGLQLNLYDILGRRQLINQAQSNYRAAGYQKESVELQLKRELINLYQDLITAQKVLHLRIEDEQNSVTSYRIAEAGLQAGGITPEAMAVTSNRHTEVLAAVESAKGQFLKFAYQLEALVGVPLYQLKRN